MFNSKTYLADLEEKNKIIDLNIFNNKKILITGSNGLICSYLIDLLMYSNIFHGTNIYVYALSRSEVKLKERFSNYYDDKHFIPVIQDVCSELEINDVDYIIHGASNANPKLYVQDPIGTMNANYIGISNVLKCAKNNKSRVVFISSGDVYGEQNKEFVKEDDYGYINILNVRSSYASSKRAAETLCVSYVEQHDVDVSIVRPAHIYGPTFTTSDSRAISDFMRNVVNGEDILMKSDGKSVRSYCYVGDCVTGILRVLLDGIKGEAYNISNNNNIISIKDLAEEIARLGNKKLIIELPSDYVEQKIDGNVKVIKMSSEKLENLNWKCATDITEGLRISLNSIFESKMV